MAAMSMASFRDSLAIPPTDEQGKRGYALVAGFAGATGRKS